MTRQPTIGVLTPLIGGFYYANILAGVQRIARRRGARVVAFQTTGMDMLWPDEPETLPLAWRTIDGFVGINDLEASDYYRRLLDAGKPLVALSARLDGDATARLRQRGHFRPRTRAAGLSPAAAAGAATLRRRAVAGQQMEHPGRLLRFRSRSARTQHCPPIRQDFCLYKQIPERSLAVIGGRGR